MQDNEETILKETSPVNQDGPGESDFSMLEDSLRMTPWERILANDDIVNFGDSLHAAMEKQIKKRRQQS
jgi:hypothetical protein